MKFRFARKLVSASLLLLLPALTLGAEGAEEAYSEYLSQVEPNVVLAGAIDLDALQAAHEGAVHVVDLRTEAEGAPEEAAAAAAMGMTYTNIPVSSAAVNSAQVAELRAALDGVGADDLVVVHCRSGNRAGLLWGAMQLEAGVPLDEVNENVSGIVTMAPISEGLETYAKELDAKL